MKPLIISLLLFPLMRARAYHHQIPCPGQNTLEMRWCLSRKWEESTQALREKLSPGTFDTLKQAHSTNRQGSIDQQMMIGCDDRLNLNLLEEREALESEEPPDHCSATRSKLIDQLANLG